ncbi:MAG TPA: glycoside hydrolase family 3 C-terminal domain-containing protein, partial [Chitinophagaceae bacterium]
MKAGIAIALLLIACLAEAQSRYQYPFQDPSVNVEKRIDNLLSLMTLEEKINCLSTNPSVPRLGVKGCGHIEGLHGVALGGPAKWGKNDPITTTQFPQAIGLAETWDTALIRSVAAAEGYEARYIFQSAKYKRGALVIRAPNADLGRDPRWGRTEECYGEDPFFNGTMVIAFVKGLQGDDPRYWQAASLMKHFLANSNEEGRGHSSSDFDERLFREYYSVPFRMGIEAGARAFMASYNAYNGIPMMVNPVLRDIAINEWKQDGIICTDGGALKLLYTEHKYYPDSAWAAAMAVKAGINQFLDRFNGPIHKALNDGLLTENDIEKSIRGDFRVMIKLGLLDPPEMVPYSGIKDGEEPWLGEKHRALARLATQKSIVLLKNENNMLPLQREKIHSIAVVGPYANQVLLDWYSGTPPYAVTVPEGIKNKLGAGVTVRFTTGNDPDSLAAITATADYVIVVVGNHTTCNAGWAQCPLPSDGKEAIDRKSIQLEQEALVKQVYRLNPRTIVALVSSFPYAITWTKHNIPAIVHLAHNSEELGNALADVLFGDYNPGGKLVQTWPLSIDQLPSMMDYNIRDGRTYMYFKGEALYPFGYGLSYTRFQYTHLTVTQMPGGGGAWISVDVKNIGSRAGDEVVQLYVQHLHSLVQRPEKELKGFKRLTLAAGETKTVRILLPKFLLAYWDTEK